LAEQETSGLSLRAFATARGLSPWTLYGWRGKLGRSKRRGSAQSIAGGESGFVAVDVFDGLRRGDDASSGIEVVLASGCRVRVPRDIAIERLVKLVRALRSC